MRGWNDDRSLCCDYVLQYIMITAAKSGLKDLFRCYEIKVTMQDFRSKAKKSWYGNYNYLVISSKLYMAV